MPQNPAMQDIPPFMRQALALATRAVGVSDPNPRVGCVIVAPDGRTVLGTGHTQPAGEAHAEVMALRDAAARGHSVAGATAWVTLEPCAHHGRTPPCCDALIAAGVGKVVAALPDPNPLVAGEGLARLRAAGIEVETGPGEVQARDLNIGFLSRMQRGLPWVRMKIAASLDGRTALESGASQWITSEEARADGHAWRARASAVLTGIGTVLEDDPRLDVRHASVPRQPLAVIVDSRLDTPVGAKMFIEGRPLLVYGAVADAARREALEKAGATVVEMPGPGGKVDLAAMLRDLARREVNELHVEAGNKLNGSLLREGLVDELLVYLAPKLLGPGRDMANIGPLAQLSDALMLDFASIEPIGPDLRIRALVKRS
jgi:diaminohydroxyphosphoribosylaminopyrimidine deaminase/5-amino-6-(5-phosphoribosylamino)uracil reductase